MANESSIQSSASKKKNEVCPSKVNKCARDAFRIVSHCQMLLLYIVCECVY